MEINPTNSDLKIIIDSEDYEKISITKWFLFYKKKNRRKKYVKSTGKIRGKQVTLHRYILGLDDKNIQVDHRDGNPLNNRKSNLRICTITENNRNKTSHINSTSKYLGVCYDRHRDKWAACLMYNRKKVFNKRFNNEIDAAIAYNNEASKYFGEFANLNQI